MEKVLSAPRKELSPYAPKITIIKINPDQIGLVIGSGGKTINGIIERAGGDTLIDIDEDGSVFISGTDQKGVAFAVAEVEALTKEYKVGEVVTGPIIKTLDFGAILDLGGGKDGMIHVSELKEGFVEKVTDIIKVGEVVTAKVVRVDSDGRIGLSLKALKKAE
jgi:polyribonucleotide nucleotidyltransferase